MAGVEENMSEEVLEYCALWCPSMLSGANMIQVWIIPGCFVPDDFGKMAVAVASTEQGCYSVHCIGAVLVGWLGMMWAREPVLTEAVGLSRQ